ncbi:hypothetical protein [Streptomyces sp. BRA346]|uniref:hypothetical protein n=1 Tax=Streptomyces sp. BRA346 TaxID=2878199 RepID=UPI004063CEBD
MSALRTGIIGTGIAVNHAAALQAIPGVGLVGVDDIEPDRAIEPVLVSADPEGAS